MAFPFLHERLRLRDPRVVAVVLMLGAQHAGLAVGSVEADGTGEVLSLGVVGEQRGTGLGTVLLKALEQVLVQRGGRRLRIAWDSALPKAAALERVLAKREWSTPRREMQLAQITGAMFAEPWIDRAVTRLPDGFSFFPWSELSEEDRAGLDKVRAEVPPALWPFVEDPAPLDPGTSLGLRCGSEVAGWMITHRVAPELVRYTSLFVRDRWRRRDVTFALLAEAMRRCPAAHGPAMRAALAVRAENGPMLRLLERKFRPYAAAWHEQRVAEKAIG